MSFLFLFFLTFFGLRFCVPAGGFRQIKDLHNCIISWNVCFSCVLLCLHFTMFSPAFGCRTPIKLIVCIVLSTQCAISIYGNIWNIPTCQQLLICFAKCFTGKRNWNFFNRRTWRTRRRENWKSPSQRTRVQARRLRPATTARTSTRAMWHASQTAAPTSPTSRYWPVWTRPRRRRSKTRFRRSTSLRLETPGVRLTSLLLPVQTRPASSPKSSSTKPRRRRCRIFVVVRSSKVSVQSANTPNPTLLRPQQVRLRRQPITSRRSSPCTNSVLSRRQTRSPFQVRKLFTPPTGGVHPLKLFWHPNTSPTGGVKSSYRPYIPWCGLYYSQVYCISLNYYSVCIKKHSFWILGRHPHPLGIRHWY